MKATLIILLLLLSPMIRAEPPINEVPMYGGQRKPTVERNTELSQDAASRGWTAYQEGDFSKAMRRFNQAGLFDQENPQAYWGFGLIMGQRASGENPRKNLEESIRYLEMALQRDPKNGRLMGDLAFSNTLLGNWHKTQGKDGSSYFGKARKLFESAHTLEPSHPPTSANWSVLLFYTGDFKAAKEKADQAIKLGYKFSDDYLAALEHHLN